VSRQPNRSQEVTGRLIATIAGSCDSWSRNRSAGGQEEQPWLVNYSTSTGLRLACARACCAASGPRWQAAARNIIENRSSRRMTPSTPLYSDFTTALPSGASLRAANELETCAC
jgi:hypothetical protein